MTNEKQLEKGKVTAVTYVYNEERYLRETLDSVVNQVDYVILGDNASTDGTEAICREYAEKYPHIKYFRNERNVGNFKNCILCYGRVTTEFVIHVGGHDLIPHGYIEELKKLLVADTDAACAFADVINFDLFGNEERFTFPMLKSFCEDAKNPNPYFRAWRFYEAYNKTCLSQGEVVWVPLFGLFRSKIYLPFIENLQMCCLWDIVLLMEAILYGTFLYSPNTTFLRRDVHVEETGNDYYDVPEKRVCGELATVSYPHDDIKSFAKANFLAFEQCNNPEYLATKPKYEFLLKCYFSKLTGEKTGYFFYDLKNQMRFCWRNSFICAKWKAFVIYFKTNCLPSWLQKRKYRKNK